MGICTIMYDLLPHIVSKEGMFVESDLEDENILFT